MAFQQFNDAGDAMVLSTGSKVLMSLAEKIFYAALKVDLTELLINFLGRPLKYFRTSVYVYLERKTLKLCLEKPVVNNYKLKIFVK